MPQLHETGYGRRFFEGDFPDMVKQLARIADALDISNNKALERTTEKSLEEAYKEIEIKVDEWFANQTGEVLGKITGYNPEDYSPAYKMSKEEQSKELTRDDAIDSGRDVWQNFDLAEKLLQKNTIEAGGKDE